MAATQQQQQQNLESQTQEMSAEQIKDLLVEAKDNPELMKQLASNPQAMGAIMQNAPQIAMSWLDGFRPRNLVDWLTLPIRAASYIDGFMRTGSAHPILGLGARLLSVIGIDRAADWIIDKHTDLIADKAGIIADRAFGFVKEQIGSPELNNVGSLNFKLDRDKVRSLLIAGGWSMGVNDLAETISERIVGAIDMTPVGGFMNNDMRNGIKKNVGGIFSNKALASTLIFGLVAANAFKDELESAFPVVKNIFKIAKPVFNALPGGIEDQLKQLQKGLSDGEFHQICQTYFVDGDRLRSASEVASSLSQFNIVEATKLEMALQKINSREGYIDVGQDTIKFPRDVSSLITGLSKFATTAHEGFQVNEKNKKDAGVLRAKMRDFVEGMTEDANRLIGSYPTLSTAVRKIIENSAGLEDEVKAVIIQGLNEAPAERRVATDGQQPEATELKQSKTPQEAIKEAAPDEFLAILRSISGGSVSATILQHPVVNSAENAESKFLLGVMATLDAAADNKDPVERAKQQVAELSRAVQGRGAEVLTPQRIGVMFNMLGPSRLDQRVLDIPKALALGGTLSDAVKTAEESLRSGNRQQAYLEFLSLDDSKSRTIN